MLLMYSQFVIGAIFGLVVCGVIGAVVAPGRGYAPAVGFFLCLFTGLLGLLLMLVVKGDLETPDERMLRLQQEQWQEQWNAYNEWQQQNAQHPFDGPLPPADR
jgi:TctA family transporter